MIGGGLALIAVGLAVLVAVARDTPIAGFAPADVASGLALAACVLAVTARTAERARPSWSATVTAVTLWLVSMGFLGMFFSHRDMLEDAARSLADLSSLGQPEAEIGQGGEVTLTRRAGGSFLVPARINDKPARFVFDTGASTVVLTHDTALQLGLKPDALTFRIPVGTANGLAMAAPVTLATMSVGTITLKQVRALVVRSGLLSENLLGQTFLERLTSYEVRGNRLVFRAGHG